MASGTWFKEILNAIMQNTPHNWSTHTLQCFPPVLAEYFQQNQVPKENKQQLKVIINNFFIEYNQSFELFNTINCGNLVKIL